MHVALIAGNLRPCVCRCQKCYCRQKEIRLWIAAESN